LDFISILLYRIVYDASVGDFSCVVWDHSLLDDEPAKWFPSFLYVYDVVDTDMSGGTVAWAAYWCWRITASMLCLS